jgi:hypothetical protein
VFLWDLLDTCDVGAWMALDELLIQKEPAFVVAVNDQSINDYSPILPLCLSYIYVLRVKTVSWK